MDTKTGGTALAPVIPVLPHESRRRFALPLRTHFRAGVSRLGRAERLILQLHVGAILLVSIYTYMRFVNVSADITLAAGISIIYILAAPIALLDARLPSFAANKRLCLLACFVLYSLIWLVAARVRVNESYQNVVVYTCLLLAYVSGLRLAKAQNPAVWTRVLWILILSTQISAIVRFAVYLKIGSSAFDTTAEQLVGDRGAACFWMLGAAAAAALTRTRRKTLAWSAAALIIVEIALTLSRTAVVAAAASVLVGRTSIKQKRGLAIGLMAALVMVAAGDWVYENVPSVKARFMTGDASLSLGGITINGSGRAKMWEAVWNSAMEAPLLGKGPGIAALVSSIAVHGMPHPHNDYLRIWHDFGLFGALMLFSWLFSEYAGITKLTLTSHKRDASGVLYGAAAGMFTAMLVTMLTDNAIVYFYVVVPVGLFAGLARGTSSRPRQRGARVRFPRYSRPRVFAPINLAKNVASNE